MIHLGKWRAIGRLPRRRATVIAATSAVAIGGIALFLPLSPARGDTITARATADTYTQETAATSNFGTGVRWSVDGRKSDLRHALLTFDVKVPAGQTIASATLRAHSESASTGTGVDAYPIAETWTETGVTWTTEPEYGNQLSNSGGYPDESWVEWDVTAGVTTEGPVSLLLSTGEPSWLGFDSRENESGLAPQLVVTTAATPTPTTTGTLTLTSPPTPTGEDIMLAAVGDINGSGVSSTTGASGQNATSIVDANPDAVLTLGDYQYEYGSCAALVGQWDKTGWGALMPKIIGSAGPTHDWSAATDTANYRDHLAGTCPGQASGRSLADAATGTDVGPDTNYVVDLGAWRVISLSSGLWRFDLTKADASTTWLDNALTASDAAGDHAIVIWHEPYWTSTTSEHTRTLAVKPWIDLLWKHHVELLLSGHQHGYARFFPQDNTGARDDASGIQEFIAGTGGDGFYPWSDSAPNVAVQQTGTFGWLKLTLHADGRYGYQFVRTSGAPFSDSGSR